MISQLCRDREGIRLVFLFNTLNNYMNLSISILQYSNDVKSNFSTVIKHHISSNSIWFSYLIIPSPYSTSRYALRYPAIYTL